MCRFIFYLVVDNSIFKCVLLCDIDLIWNRIRDSELKYIQKYLYLKIKFYGGFIVYQILISEKNHSSSD